MIAQFLGWGGGGVNLIPLHLCHDTNHARSSQMMYVYRQCTHEHRCNTVHPKHQQNIVTSVIYVVCMRVCGTDSRVQCVCVCVCVCVWLTGSKRSTGAEPYLVATMPSRGLKQETLERGGNSQGMLSISWAGRHSAWWYKHMRRKRLAH